MSDAVKVLPVVTMLAVLEAFSSSPDFVDPQDIAAKLVASGFDTSRSFFAAFHQAEDQGLIDLCARGCGDYETQLGYNLSRRGDDELERLQYLERTRVARACANAALDDIFAEMDGAA